MTYHCCEHTINGKTYTTYWGDHDELRAMLREGDIVLLRRQNKNDTERIEVFGTVTEVDKNIVTVSACGGEQDYVLGRPSTHPPYLYEIHFIERPGRHLNLPDEPGLWQDCNGNLWLIENGTLNGQCIRYGADWSSGHLRRVSPDEYREVAPFTKLTVRRDPDEEATRS